jgi:hypothetical protein
MGREEILWVTSRPKETANKRSPSVHGIATHCSRNRYSLFTIGYVFVSYSEIDIVEGGQGMKRRSHNGVVGRLAEVAGRDK